MKDYAMNDSEFNVDCDRYQFLHKDHIQNLMLLEFIDVAEKLLKIQGRDFDTEFAKRKIRSES